MDRALVRSWRGLRGEVRGAWPHWRDLGLVIVGSLATLELSRTLWDSANGDVSGYAYWARAFWAGHLPFRALPVEYPPGAVVPFALTLIPVGDPVLAFLVGMAAIFVASYLLFARVSGRAAANRYALYALVGAQGTLLDRYDLFPALLTLGSLWLTQRGRFVLAYVLLAGGVALKLYPAVLIPVVAIAQWQALGGVKEARVVVRRVGRVVGGVTICGVLIGVTTVVPMVLSRTGLSSLHYAAERPVQVESLQGTLVWLGTLVGVPAQVMDDFGSQGFVGSLATALPGLGMIALVIGCAWVYLRQMRGKLALDGVFLALLCVLVLTSKVFSAQYFIWLAPLAAEMGGYELLWIAVAVLTFLDYPLIFPYSKSIPPLGDVWLYMLTIALRNAVLVCVTALLLVRRSLPRGVQGVGVVGEEVRRGDGHVRWRGGGASLDVAGNESGPSGGEDREDDGGGEAPLPRAEETAGRVRAPGG